MRKKTTKVLLKERKEPELADVLNAVNDGFTAMEARFQMVDKRFEMVDRRFDDVDKRFEQMQGQIDSRFREVFTVLDGHTKKLEGLEQEKLFSFHAVHRLEKEIERMKKHLHMN